MIKKILVIVFLILDLSALSYAEMRDVPLLKNPFVKPNRVTDLAVEQRDSSNKEEVLTDRNLRATLSSNKRSIANVDGIMVLEGGQVKGYTLISVGEGSATFVKNEKEITLNVSELHKKLK